MLQYVTDAAAKRSVEDQIKEVLAAGGTWITIDPAGMSDEDVKALVEKIMPACLEKQAFLILKDRVALAKEINVGGVVLSKGGDTPSSARMTLGAAAVVGAEVESTQEIDRLIGIDVDYVVTTYTNFGLDGAKDLCKHMEDKQMELPRVAFEGVAYDDIAPLMDAGCNGVAMSEAIANADDIASAVEKANALLKKYEEKERATIND